MCNSLIALGNFVIADAAPLTMIEYLGRLVAGSPSSKAI
jgi:hypothetical protein